MHSNFFRRQKTVLIGNLESQTWLKRTYIIYLIKFLNKMSSHSNPSSLKFLGKSKQGSLEKKENLKL